MFNFFYSRQINNEVFGKLEYRKYLFHKNFWKGKVNFSPVSNKIDIYIVAGKYGILEKRRDFFLDLEAKFINLSEKIFECLTDILIDYHGKDFVNKLIKKEMLDEEFNLERLYIPNFETSPDEEWELSYLFKRYNQSYTLYFEDWKILRSSFDD